MFMNPKRFISLFTGAFFGKSLPKFVTSGIAESQEAKRSRERSGKGNGRSSPPVRNAAHHKRAAKKSKGRALNKARHAS